MSLAAPMPIKAESIITARAFIRTYEIDDLALWVDGKVVDRLAPDWGERVSRPPMLLFQSSRVLFRRRNMTLDENV
jgi:hypothetical protein